MGSVHAFLRSNLPAMSQWMQSVESGICNIRVGQEMEHQSLTSRMYNISTSQTALTETGRSNQLLIAGNRDTLESILARQENVHQSHTLSLDHLASSLQSLPRQSDLDRLLSENCRGNQLANASPLQRRRRYLPSVTTTVANDTPLPPTESRALIRTPDQSLIVPMSAMLQMIKSLTLHVWKAIGIVIQGEDRDGEAACLVVASAAFILSLHGLSHEFKSNLFALTAFVAFAHVARALPPNDSIILIDVLSNRIYLSFDVCITPEIFHETLTKLFDDPEKPEYQAALRYVCQNDYRIEDSKTSGEISRKLWTLRAGMEVELAIVLRRTEFESVRCPSCWEIAAEREDALHKTSLQCMQCNRTFSTSTAVAEQNAACFESGTFPDAFSEQLDDHLETPEGIDISQPSEQLNEERNPSEQPNISGSAPDVGQERQGDSCQAMFRRLHLAVAWIQEAFTLADVLPGSCLPTTEGAVLNFLQKSCLSKRYNLSGRVQIIGDRFALTQGSRADVYTGLMDGTERVAVKVIRVDAEGPYYARKRLLRELSIWDRLMSGYETHKNLARLIGIVDVLNKPMPGLVCPQYECDIVEQVRSHPSQKKRLIAELTEGMAYLHSHMVIHGDIKPANVLVTKTERAKITDFGSGRIEGVFGFDECVDRNPRYSAPELMPIELLEYGTDDQPTYKSDVFGVAMVILEVLQGPTPRTYKGYEFCASIPYNQHPLRRHNRFLSTTVHKSRGGLRPRREHYSNISYRDFSQLGLYWQDDPRHRPSMDKVARDFAI